MQELIFDVKENEMGELPLQLVPVILDKDYRSLVNTNLDDFLLLTRGSKIVIDSLFRKGGLNHKDFYKDPFFTILRYKEKKSESTGKLYLDGDWCIINQKGEIVAEFDNCLHAPYVISGSVIYVLSRTYYNLLTGEEYCTTSKSRLESEEYIFVENTFNTDKTRLGVFQINKKTGEYIIHKNSK